MTYDEKGLTLTEGYEGLRLTSYQDSVGVWTIGYGHTGTDVGPGMTITQAEAKALLAADIQTAVNCVNNAVNVALTQDQFDALVDFVYNVGCANFRKSTLLKNINAGQFQTAADQLLIWNKANGHILAGLVSRRTGERALFLA
jgi:lysozyme